MPRSDIESVLRQSETNSILRAGVLDRPPLARFARAVASFDEMEPAVGAALTASLMPGESIRQIIVAPKQRLLGTRSLLGPYKFLLPWELTPDWVLVLTEGRVLVASVARLGAAPAITSTCIPDILSLETGNILLHSWIEWSWANQGHVDHTRIYYNAVGQRLFGNVLDSLRRDLVAQSNFPAVQSGRHLEYLAELPFKFMNIITHNLLLPDEQIQTVVYRPAIWTGQHRLFRRQLTATMTLVLSNYHLLLAEEDLTGRPDAWGLITRFCPRSRIRCAALEESQNGLWLRLTLERQGVEQEIGVLFQSGAAAVIRELLHLLQVL
jgi:hypothetical protein